VTFDTLSLSVEDGLATVTLDNPPVNAIDQGARRELNDLLDRLREDDVRAAVFSGTGEVFSVGADISLFERARSWTTQEFRRNSRVLGEVFDGLETMEKPALAAVSGTCVGGGLELALACDVRIVAPDATLGFPEHNIGLVPGLGGCSRLVHLVGPGKAKDLVFSGELVDGATAHDLGIAERLADDPEDAAREYARDLLSKPPQAIGLAKRVINESRTSDVRTAGLLESLAQSTLIKTEDHAEGIEAFREKRDPEFTGR
jgi:enoyl-CoA hydratase/carnithine racemase